jgi:hypothetical protein
MALGAVRINLQKTGKDQFKHCVGVLSAEDDTSWEDQYRSNFNVEVMRSSYLNRKEVNVGQLDEASVNCFKDLLKDLSDMCKNIQGSILKNSISAEIFLSSLSYRQFSTQITTILN